MNVSSEVRRERLYNAWTIFLTTANCVLFVAVIAAYFSEDATYSIIYNIADGFVLIQCLLFTVRSWNWTDIEYINCLLILLYHASLFLLLLVVIFI